VPLKKNYYHEENSEALSEAIWSLD